MDHTQYTTNGAERKPGTHLTMEDRGAIQAMKKLGHSNRAIARYLHCSPTTISNELKRGTPPRTDSRGRAPGYSAKRGDAVYKENRKNSHKPHRIDKCTSFVQWVVTQGSFDFDWATEFHSEKQGCREIRHPFTTLTVESPSVSPMEDRRFCFIPDGFLSCPGIEVVFPFSDITIVEGKSSTNYFRFFRFPFPCT